MDALEVVLGGFAQMRRLLVRVEAEGEGAVGGADLGVCGGWVAGEA